jgi:UDPglucose--hexose-1-phosphate uridylyltransferase
VTAVTRHPCLAQPGAAPELRLDPLTREWVAITGSRQTRPNLPSSDCPFCVGGLEACDPYVVKAFPNRWPPLVPGERLRLSNTGGSPVPARGAAEVVLYSPDHDASLATLPEEQVRAVVDLWTERTEELLARSEIRYVLVFENRGAEVGATISHPHGQIYAFPFVPPGPEREAAIHAAFGCPICEELERNLIDGSLTVDGNESFEVLARYAPRWPFELMIAPREHIPDLAHLDHCRRDDLAGVLRDALGRYEGLFGQPMPYMLWVHPGFHVHLHVVTTRRTADTLRYVAAGELGSGLMFNPVTPEDAASALRAVDLDVVRCPGRC